MIRNRIIAWAIGAIMFNINVAVISAIGTLILVWMIVSFLTRITEED